jgi:hypothetical protein
MASTTITEASSIRLPQNQILKGEENYAVWKPQIIQLLSSKYLEEYIEESMVVPDRPIKVADEVQDAFDAKYQKYRDWKANNAKAYMVLTQNAAAEPNQLISEATSVKEIWSIFQTMYEGKGHNLIHKYIVEISNIRFEYTGSVISYIVQFKSLVQKLASLKTGAPSQWYTVLFIAGLENSFPVWAERQRSNDRSDK